MENKEEKPKKKGSPIAALLAFLLVIALPISLLVFDVWRVVFNPTLIKEVLTDEVVNSDLIPASLEWFSEQRAAAREASGIALTGVDEPDVIILLSFMDRDDWRAIKEEVLTDEFLTNLVSVTVDGTYSWLDIPDPVPQGSFDMRPFIDRVHSDHGVNSVLSAYENLPECTQEQINDFTARQDAAPPNTEVLYNLCEFPDPWHEDQLSDYENAVFKVVENIPPRLDMTANLAQSEDTEGVGPRNIKNLLLNIRLFGQYAWVLPVLLVLLIAAVGIRSLGDLGRWLGKPFIWGGILTLGISLSLKNFVISGLSAGLMSETPELIRSEVGRVVGRLGDVIFIPMALQAAVLVLLGFVFVILAKRSKPNPAA
jgi:hypothetical protein